MICARPPPGREILDPVARPLYCRMADCRSFTVEAIVIASTARERSRVTLDALALARARFVLLDFHTRDSSVFISRLECH